MVLCQSPQYAQRYALRAMGRRLHFWRPTRRTNLVASLALRARLWVAYRTLPPALEQILSPRADRPSGFGSTRVHAGRPKKTNGQSSFGHGLRGL